jgi:hypothetical protein
MTRIAPNMRLAVAGLCGALALAAIVFYLTGGRQMTTNCHQIEPDLWPDLRGGMAVEPTPLLDRRSRQVTLHLGFPVRLMADDLLYITAGSDRDDVLYVGPVPPDGIVTLAFPVLPATGTAAYTMGFQLIRTEDRMICVWAGEERLDLPAEPDGTAWRVDLLGAAVPTDDGGQRWTRFIPL